MNILIYLGHPAQYLFLRETINRLHFKCHKTTILIKTKDVDIVQGHEAERITENTPKDGIYCWFFNKLRFDNNTLLEEKYGDVAWRC